MQAYTLMLDKLTHIDHNMRKFLHETNTSTAFLSPRYQLSHNVISSLTSKEILIFHTKIMNFGYKDLYFNTLTQEQVQIRLVLHSIGFPLFSLLRFTTKDSTIAVRLFWLVMLV